MAPGTTASDNQPSRKTEFEHLLTVQEYADGHRVHIQTVYSAIRDGRLQHRVVRVGRAIRIDVSRGK